MTQRRSTARDGSFGHGCTTMYASGERAKSDAMILASSSNDRICVAHFEPVVTSESTLPMVTWDDGMRGRLSFRTLFGGEAGPSAFASAGIAYLEPGQWLGRHRHSAGEMYLVVSGVGIMVLDGVEHEVSAEQAIFVPGGIEHGIRNDSSHRLTFFYAFDVTSFADVVYQFPGRDYQ